ncbi:MAG: TIR domain-containing protein [Candidatus Atribacteria bacterium]|nr:TIR domain-containing protein [Candidatus Atribacteria bacterium]
MVRRVFFSFHYEKDSVRASQVRNSSVTKPDLETAGYVDAADWEEIKKGGDKAIKKWIAENLKNTSVTAVLIGTETSNRDWVTYEIKESYNRGNGMLGIYIHNCKDFNGQTCAKGENPFGNLYITDEYGNKTYLSELYPTYDWVYNDGYNNFGDWVEEAAKAAGR